MLKLLCIFQVAPWRLIAYCLLTSAGGSITMYGPCGVASVISTKGKNLRSLTLVRDDNAVSGRCGTVSRAAEKGGRLG